MGIQGTFIDHLSSVSYQVEVFNGMLQRRYVQRVTEKEPEILIDTSNSKSSKEFTTSLPDMTTL